MLESAQTALVTGTLALLSAALALGGVVTIVLAIFTVFDPPGSALMLWRSFETMPAGQVGKSVRYSWVPLQRISPNLIRAVIAAEDGRFCQHWGVDLQELERAFKRLHHHNFSKIRGASTISMQLTKNLFLWPGRSLSRKGLELAITPLLELIWTKRRILEVYLNIVEWGPGIYGAEAAARHYFRRPAKSLTARQASVMAAILPNPLRRSASRPGRKTRIYAAIIRRRMARHGFQIGCIIKRRRW